MFQKFRIQLKIHFLLLLIKTYNNQDIPAQFLD